MLWIGMGFLALGSVGTLAAVILEWKRHEPVYALMMKIFPWAFGVGGVLIGLSLRQGG